VGGSRGNGAVVVGMSGVRAGKLQPALAWPAGTRDNYSSLIRRVGAILRYAPLYIAGTVAGFALATPGGDWIQWWRAGSILASGHSVYDPAAWAGQCKLAAEVCAWLYPPLVGVLAQLLTILPIDLAYVVIRLGTLSATFAGLIYVSRLWTANFPRVEPLLVATVALSAPFITTISWSHFDGVLLFTLALLATSLKRNTALGLGIAVLALSLKPHLFIGLGAGILVALTYSRSWRLLGWATATAVAVASVSLALAPDYLAQLLSFGETKVVVSSPTTTSLAHLAFPDLWFAPILLTLVIGTTATTLAVVAVRAVASSQRFNALVAVSMAVSLLVSPYAQVYDELLLVPLLAMTLNTAASTGQKVRILFVTMTCVLYLAAGWLVLFGGAIAQVSALLPVVMLGTLAIISSSKVRSPVDDNRAIRSAHGLGVFGLRWHRGQWNVPRPPTTVRAIALPQRGHGSPARE
jgi:hypothetical protein